MKILLTGATGFTGSFVTPLLLHKGHEVRCLVRPQSDTSGLPEGVEIFFGDLNDPDGLRRAMTGRETLVNVASMGFGHGPGVAAAARDAGVRRGVFVSTTAIFTTLAAPSKKIRLEAERSVMESGLAWTILRPTMIYGTRRDRNMCRLLRYLKKWPVVPVFGDGGRLMQPVHVEDLAWALAEVPEKENTAGQAYNMSGTAPLTFNEVIDQAAAALNRRVRKMHVPAGPVIAMLKMLEKLAAGRLPLKAEQVQRLGEDKAFGYEEATRDFGYRPRSFEEGIRAEALEMGLV